MRFQKINPGMRGLRLLLRYGAALALFSSAAAFADEATQDVRNSPERQAFLAGTSKDCPGCDLRDAKLKRRDLSGADLTGADLTDAVLHAARLTNAKLGHTKLEDANLNKADMKRADLTGADF